MGAVVVVVVPLVGSLYCHEEALGLLAVDHPTGFLRAGGADFKKIENRKLKVYAGRRVLG